VQGESIIELAMDEGQVLASGRSRVVRELELELVEGDVRDLLALARRWRARFGLWLSTASKAARGYQLLSGDVYGPPVSAGSLKLAPKSSMGEFTAAVLDSCMEQVIANASELAAGSQADEHIHQARVGLRRLRTALRELPTLAGDSERYEPVLVEVFRALGERRDRTHVLRNIEPLVEAAGGAPLRVPSEFHEGPDPGNLVRSDDFQDALFGLLICAEQARASPPGGGVRGAMHGRLSRLHKQVMRDGRRFTHLEEVRQHRVRKRLKRLRYLCEFMAPLYSKDAVDRYLAEIKPAQDTLGHYYDEIMAQRMFDELAHTDPGARFGVEWLQARRPMEAKACRRTLRKLKSADGFWTKKR
jgi:CHAD domain-containing protein